jgi:hypothetical protein
VSFHNNNRSPCSYIHDKFNQVTEDEADRIIWPEIKIKILNFMSEVRLHNNIDIDIDKYIKVIEGFNIPSDIYLYWGYSKIINARVSWKNMCMF